jgi:hypothetical protein
VRRAFRYRLWTNANQERELGIKEGAPAVVATALSRFPMVLPAGRYVMVVRLVLETTADGLFRSHAESVFAPGSHGGTWVSRSNPPPGQEVGIAPLVAPPPALEGENFGFAVSLLVDAPPPD